MVKNPSANNFTLDDIVFEGRNRAYGAYLLRKLYSENLLKATLAATALFLLLLCIPIAYNMLRPETEAFKPIINEGYKLTQVDFIEPVIPPDPVQPQKKQPTSSAPKVNTSTHIPPKVVPNEQAPENSTILDDDELSNVNIGTTTITDGIDGPPAGIEVENTTSGGSGTGIATETGEAFILVEQMPTYGAGDADLLRYLAKNIRYPSKARDMGVEGMVVVSFVIAPDGSLTNIQLVQGLGYGTEEEAIRVLKEMPKWKPGYQNGQAVPVKITLPVRFKIQKN